MKKSNSRPVEAMRIKVDVATIMIKTTSTMKVITWINYEQRHVYPSLM